MRLRWEYVLALALIVFSSSGIGASAARQSSSSIAGYQFNYPVAFESNAGQTSSEVRYVSRGMDYRLFLTTTDAVLAFKTQSGERSTYEANSAPGGELRIPGSSKVLRASPSVSNFVRFHLFGTSRNTTPAGRKVLPSYSNYLIGNDPEKWHVRVPQFAEVWYRDIYPGVDLVYYGDAGQLEFDFNVAPGADPNRINFSIQETGITQSSVRVNRTGDLVIPTAQGQVSLHKPLLYQGKSCTRDRVNRTQDTTDCRAIGEGRFRIRRTGRSAVQVGFQLPAYDHAQPLVIDPSVSFSTFLGGSMGDGVDAMALDSAGNIYLLGDTNSPDFPTTFEAYQKNIKGDVDGFITKLSSDGSHIIYSTFLGGSDAEYPKGIALDLANNVYVTGETYSKDFPLVHPYQTQNATGTGFVSKLSADGSSLVYSTYLGGSLEGASNAIVVDSSGEAVVAGRTYSTDFPVVNALQPAHSADNGNTDAFVTKFAADGASLVFSTYFGGDANDAATGVTLDSFGNIYVAGVTSSTDFPTTPGAFQTSYISDPWNSSFISKFSPSGTSLLYSTYLVDCSAYGIAVSGAGNAFVTGLAGWFAFPVTAGAFQTVQGGGSSTDAFVTELDATGSSLVYSTFLGGNNEDTGYAIALDSSNNAYVTGTTSSANFPLQAPVQTNFYAGVPSVFVTELNSTGAVLAFSTYWGGGALGYGGQQGNAIAVAGVGSIYVAGSTTTPDFPVVNALQRQLSGPGDAFIAKFVVPPDFALSGSPSSITISAGQVATYSLTLTPLNGFNQDISFSCSGVPTGSTCTVSPSTLTLDGTNAALATLKVTTLARSASVLGPGVVGTRFAQGGANNTRIGFGMIALMAFCCARFRTSRHVRTRTMATTTFVLLASLLVACGGGQPGGGGGGGGGTQPGNYTISVTAASGGNLNHSDSFALIVR